MITVDTGRKVRRCTNVVGNTQNPSIEDMVVLKTAVQVLNIWNDSATSVVENFP